jgi:branched-chain amino acid transport system ATP-binding protein
LRGISAYAYFTLIFLKIAHVTIEAAGGLLAVSGLSVSYGLNQVLFDVTLAAPRHGAVAVPGRNSACKSTLLKKIVGELAPGSSIVLNVEDITLLPTERRIHTGLDYVPHEHSVFNRLSVRENRELGALTNRDRSAIDQVLAWFPKLGRRLGQPAGTLSGGERKMLAIDRVILLRPKLLLLDEPTEGVWIGCGGDRRMLARPHQSDIAVVVVEQHLELALGVVHHTYVLDRARVVLEGRSAAVRKDPALLQLLAP